MTDTPFTEFYRAHYGRVLRFIERRIDDRYAEDICARCFEIAFKKFDPAHPFGLPWLYQTARHLLGNTYRKRDRERLLIEHVGQQQWPPEDRITDEDLWLALARLPPKDREAIQLTYWEGLTAAEVGVVLLCSEQAAWKRISRAKQKLRALIEAESKGEETRVTR